MWLNYRMFVLREPMRLTHPFGGLPVSAVSVDAGFSTTAVRRAPVPPAGRTTCSTPPASGLTADGGSDCAPTRAAGRLCLSDRPSWSRLADDTDAAEALTMRSTASSRYNSLALAAGEAPGARPGRAEVEPEK